MHRGGARFPVRVSVLFVRFSVKYRSVMKMRCLGMFWKEVNSGEMRNILLD